VSVAVELGASERGAAWFRRVSLGRWASPIALLLLWELGSRTGVIPTRILAAPSSVAVTLWSMIISASCRPTSWSPWAGRGQAF